MGLSQRPKLHQSFPNNEWIILLICVQEPVCPDVQMKVSLLMSLMSLQGSPACGGVTSSPAVAGEVALTFRQAC